MDTEIQLQNYKEQENIRTRDYTVESLLSNDYQTDILRERMRNDNLNDRILEFQQDYENVVLWIYYIEEKANANIIW